MSNLLLRVLHDQVVREYRAKREDESWYQWWLAYQHDVEGVDTQDLFWTIRPC